MKRNSQLDPTLRDLPEIPPGLRPTLKLVGRKTRPAEAEIKSNPRARSALLRVAEKVAQ
jgi:16S rRNA (cytosine1402-N4)-methyltransferase